MAINLLTTASLKAVSDKDVGSILNDGGGLRARVRRSRSGAIAIQFEYKYRDGTKYRTTKVDQWPKNSLADIRSQCREIKSDLANGIDPIESRKSEKLERKLEQVQQIERQRQELQHLAIEAANRRTFSDAVDQWEKLELARRKDKGQETRRALQKDILPVLGATPLIDVKRALLVAVLDDVVARGARTMANHLFADLRQFFTFAIARDWVEVHPLMGLTKEKIGGRQKERERYLSEEEIVDLKHRLPTANLLRSTELAAWILLSTCCRIGEISKARWSDVDLDRAEWRIPAANSKNAKEHTVFLSDFALTQLEELESITGSTDWCLPSRDEKGHICPKSVAKQIKDRVRDAPLKGRSKASGALLLAGGAWTPHDLRRTGATMMGELGVMGEVIDRCLNHVEGNKLKRTYQRHELKGEQREAWRLLGDRLTLLHSDDAHKNAIVGRFERRVNKV